MVIVEDLIPLPTGNLCTVDNVYNDKTPKCGLLHLKGSELTCYQEDCNGHHPAICVENNIHTS